MAKENGFARRHLVHIILIPGFGAFDALGQVQYYAGITSLFQSWTKRNHSSAPVVLHYFDNLPTAAVSSRASRLRAYIGKRMARGEILEQDKVVLVGHSTGGLDIRRLICDLDDPENTFTQVDGGQMLPSRQIREALSAAVFLSVPHWGTNIADWVYSHPALRATIVAKLRAAVAGSQIYLLDAIESGLAGSAAALTDAEMLLALQDALTEANQHYGKPGPLRTADAQEAASELELYFRQMASDFHVINDLTSQPHDPKRKSPAHFNEEERRKELALWKDPRIDVLSYVTVGGRPFRFPSNQPAPVWDLVNPLSYPETTQGTDLSAKTDFSYRLCYRMCAGGPFRWPAQAGEITRMLGKDPPPERLELWDNDGIVNTASMLWPLGDRVLVRGDHLDIVGHYELVETPEAMRKKSYYGVARRYQSYDSLQSIPKFTTRMFEEVWTEIFDFSTNPQQFSKKKTQPKLVKRAAATA
jgi:triacylglycerol lipase